MPLDHALVVPAHRGRGVSGLRLGAPRDARPRSHGRPLGTTCSRRRASRSRCSRGRSSTRSPVVLAACDPPARPRASGRLRATLRAPLVLGVLYVAGRPGRDRHSSRAAVTSSARTRRPRSGNPLPAGILGRRLRISRSSRSPAGLLPFVIGGGWLVVESPQQREHESGSTFAWLAVDDDRRSDARGRVVRPPLRRRARPRALPLLPHAGAAASRSPRR